MSAIFAVFQIPILLLNFFGFIASLIWLLIIGQWGSVIGGIVIAIAAPLFLGLAVLPSMIFAAPANFFVERGLTIGVYFCSFLASIYVATLITTWCGAITFYFLRDAPPQAFWPMLIWSYCVATSPWTYMAQKDQGLGSHLAAFFAQAAFIVMMGAIAVGAELETGAQFFAAVMVIAVVFHMRLIAETRHSWAQDT